MKKPRRKIVAAIAILALSVGISSCAMESPKLLTAQADTPTAEGVCNPSDHLRNRGGKFGAGSC